MLVLQDCISKLSEFKQTFGNQFGITRLGIFGSVARQENTEDSDIDIVVEVEKPTLSVMYELSIVQLQRRSCKIPLHAPSTIQVEHFKRCGLCLNS